MAGDRAIYDKAMNTGHSAAWDQQWDRAIAAYGRAVQEFPEDPDAHRSLGLALLQAQRLDEALKVYTRAHQLAPDDPIPLEKSADVLERMGRLREAAQQYIKVAEVYIAQRDLDKAINNWERATRLTTGLIQIHAKLATAFERIGSNKQAIREYLTLAYNFQRLGDMEKATQVVQRALRLDRSNAAALNALRALESGSPVSPPVDEDSHAERRQNAFNMPSEKQHLAANDPRGPLGEAEELALSDLAMHVFEAGELSSGSMYAIQAIELHRQRVVKETITAYEQALQARYSHPAIHLNVGLLYLDENPRAAIEHLTLAMADPRLAAGANHGLGRAYIALQQPQQAARHLVETLRLADLAQAATEDEQNRLNVVYTELVASIPGADRMQLAAMNTRLISLLSGPDWKQRIAETRRQLEETTRTEGAAGIVEQLAEGGEELTESVSRIDQYVRDGRLTLAMDEAFHAVEIAPTYLPIHLRMAQILLEDRQLQPALAKYKIVADAYMVRGQTEHASGVLNSVLKVAPMDLEVRARLIKILEKEERWNKALDQHVQMADAYYQLADFDKARDTYENAYSLAQRLNAAPEQVIHILHRLADIDVTRLDLKRALRTYEQIKSMVPGDERARKALMDLYYRLNNRVEAVKELDELMRLYAQQQRPDLITRVLEEQVTLYPQEMALRSRLAALYRRMGRTADAVAQMDALGELQLDAGMQRAAAETIRQIISLNPPGVDDYKKLLRSLGG